MKKKILTTTLVAAMAMGAATATYAGWGQRGGGYGNNNMVGPGPQMQMRYNQVDPAVQEKLDKFFTDTRDIRRELAVKRAERMAMVRSDNPDPEAVGKLAGEIFDLRTTMRQKAEEAGVTAYLGPMNGPRAGRHFGPGNRGMNRGMNNMQGGPGPRGNWY